MWSRIRTFGLIFVLNNNDQIFLLFFWKEKILLRKVIKRINVCSYMAHIIYLFYEIFKELSLFHFFNKMFFKIIY